MMMGVGPNADQPLNLSTISSLHTSSSGIISRTFDSNGATVEVDVAG